MKPKLMDEEIYEAVKVDETVLAADNSERKQT